MPHSFMYYFRSAIMGFIFIKILCFSPTSTAAIYKCIDADIKVYFSDRQCDERKKQTKIELKSDSASAPGHTYQNWRRTLQAIEKEKQIKKAKKKRQKEMREAQEKAYWKVQCQHDREQLSKLNSRTCNHQGDCTIYALMGYDENGKKIVLSEHAKQDEIKRLEASIKNALQLKHLSGYCMPFGLEHICI